jgi:sulfur relay (sulfurtransferase) DsrF/TusC family protein
LNYITILITVSPYSSNIAKDVQNVIFSASSFFKKIKIIFSFQAPYQILQNQNPVEYLYKNFIDTIKSFRWYDIDEVYITNQTNGSKSEYQFNANHPCYNSIQNTAIPFKIISSMQASDVIKKSLHCFIY